MKARCGRFAAKYDRESQHDGGKRKAGLVDRESGLGTARGDVSEPSFALAKAFYLRLMSH
jgi:hypothetical protein